MNTESDLKNLFKIFIYLFGHTSTWIFNLHCDILPGATMGGPARDEVMKKIPGRQGRPGPHP